MADEVTSTIEKTPEQIEQEMLETREALTEKVTALESQVVDTVQTAADTISDTVQAVRSFVTTAPETVSETVKRTAAAVGEAMKETFDITGRVRRYPWAAVGLSAMLGCTVGWMISRRSSLGAPEGYVPAMAGAAKEVRTSLEYEPRVEETPRAPSEPGVLDEMLGMVGAKVKDLARTALETVSASLSEGIKTGLPKLMNEATARLADMGAMSEASAYRSDAGTRNGCA